MIDSFLPCTSPFLINGDLCKADGECGTRGDLNNRGCSDIYEVVTVANRPSARPGHGDMTICTPPASVGQCGPCISSSQCNGGRCCPSKHICIGVKNCPPTRTDCESGCGSFNYGDGRGGCKSSQCPIYKSWGNFDPIKGLRFPDGPDDVPTKDDFRGLWASPTCKGDGGLRADDWIHFKAVNEVRQSGYTCTNRNDDGTEKKACKSSDGCPDITFSPAEPLTFDCKLWAIARSHSEDMATNEYFSHTSPDGETMSQRAVRGGTTTHGENIARGYNDPKVTLQQWLNSYGHCKNIMNPDFKYFAVGYHFGSRYKYGFAWTQNFRYNDGGHSKTERTDCYAGKFD